MLCHILASGMQEGSRHSESRSASPEPRPTFAESTVEHAGSNNLDSTRSDASSSEVQSKLSPPVRPQGIRESSVDTVGSVSMPAR